MLPFSPPAGTPMMGVTPSVVPTLPTFSLHTPGPSQLLAESPLAQPIPSLSAPGPCPPAQTAASFTQSDALPPKLKKKILELEFVDMAELIPDTWRWQDDDDSKCCHKPHRTPRRGPVTDILLWVECYATLVSVLTTRFPDKAPELMAYLRAIVHAQRTYYGDGWVTYDACYRRQAAASKTLNWSQINFTLYNEAFTGRAKPLQRCMYCLSEHHRSADCRDAPDAPPRKRVLLGRNELALDGPAVQLCRLYNDPNGNRCRYKACKFAHFCMDPACRGQHPQSECPRYRRGSTRPGTSGPTGRSPSRRASSAPRS